MAELSKNEVRAMKRMERRSAVRQALFTCDYIKTKQPHIFKEAAELYNELNAFHPRKPDLRRCLEYKCWKDNIVREQGKGKTRASKTRVRKPYQYNIVPYDDIIVKPSQPQKTMQLNIELMPTPFNNQNQETVIQEPAPQESNPPSSPVEQPLTEPAEDIEPAGDIEPYRPGEEIHPAILEKIIGELRLDPQLSALMDEVETGIQDENLELTVPELEVDIPELEQIFEQDDIFW